jgi:hypothetical protein
LVKPKKDELKVEEIKNKKDIQDGIKCAVDEEETRLSVFLI